MLSRQYRHSKSAEIPFRSRRDLSFYYLSFMQEIALTVDVVLCRNSMDHKEVLLIQRKNNPFKGKWALPGGFVETDEPLDVAALRELKEETGILLNKICQVGAFGSPDRDPRQRVVTIAYYSFLKQDQEIKADTDASDAKWFDLKELPKLAFDHSNILQRALSKYNS